MDASVPAPPSGPPGPAPVVLVLPEGVAPERLDKALAAVAPEGEGLSRSRLAKLLAEGAVIGPDGREVGPREKAVAGSYTVHLAPPVPIDAAPEAIPLVIVHEDDDLIVIDKPAGLVVHPAAGSPSGTLVNALLAHCGGTLSGIGGAARPGIVHRLDKDTSGLLVVAKTDRAHQGLAAQFAAHTVERRYLALAHGVIAAGDPRLRGLPGVGVEAGGTLRIATAIGRHPTDRQRQAVLASGGRHAVTRARMLEGYGGAAMLAECRLETGRTHQIRVHLTHCGLPLIGDRTYGGARRPPASLGDAADAIRAFPRQALHAASLGFVHPASGEAMRWESPLPPDMAALRQTLRAAG